MTEKLEGRVLGGLWGAVVGDALGVPVEFTSREERKKDPVTDMRGFGTHHQPPGDLVRRQLPDPSVPSRASLPDLTSRTWGNGLSGGTGKDTGRRGIRYRYLGHNSERDHPALPGRRSRDCG